MKLKFRYQVYITVLGTARVFYEPSLTVKSKGETTETSRLKSYEIHLNQ